MKLSPTQKEIIKMLRMGWLINHNQLFDNVWLSYPNNSPKKIHKSAFNSIYLKGLIKADNDPIERHYELTELGKTIEL